MIQRCHPERSHEESVAILIAESKDPCPVSGRRERNKDVLTTNAGEIPPSGRKCASIIGILRLRIGFAFAKLILRSG